MRIAPIAAGVLVFAGFTSGSAFAGQRGQTTPHGNSHAAAPTTPTQTTAQGGGRQSQGGTTTHGSGQQPRTGTSTTTHDGDRRTTTGSTPTSTTSNTPTPSTTENRIAARISRNPQLANRLTAMLPQGMTLETACAGFRNQGQFIAALHVSRNLHISFADLQTAMTGPNAVSLGQAIHTLRPSADATSEVRRANGQAQQDLR